jgi:hypothetical protein
MAKSIDRALILATAFINIAIVTSPGNSIAHERTRVTLRWSDIVARVRYSGLDLLTLPVLSGKTYIAEAYRQDGSKVRVFLSAVTGDFLAIEPAATGIYRPAQTVDRPAGGQNGSEGKHRSQRKTAKITATTAPIEAKPVAFKTDSATTSIDTKTVAHMQKSSADAFAGEANSLATNANITSSTKIQGPSSPQRDDRTTIVATKENATTDAKAAVQISIEPADPRDPVIAKAEGTIIAKMESPTVVVFSDVHRALRKNVLDQSIDTLCGYVNGKNALGADIGERPFLYLVKEDEAYIVDGTNDIVALVAYRNSCN